MAQIDHPFVVNLRYAFQDDENCFFVLDLMLGGDLRCESHRSRDRASCTRLRSSADQMYVVCVVITVHIDRMGGFEEKAVRFYVAEIALALDYLHSIRIVHRYVSFVPTILLPTSRGLV